MRVLIGWKRWAVAALVCAAGPLSADETPTALADPRRPPAIETAGVPPVPDALAETLRRYQNTRTAVFSGWSPAGQGILIQTRFGNSAQLHRVYEPGGRREQVTFFDEPTSGRFIPKAQDGALLTTQSRGGDENFQIHLLDQAAYRTQLLTDGTSRNELGPIHHDGAKLIFSSNRRNGRDTDLYLAGCRGDLAPEMILQTNGQFWTPTDWSQDGGRLLLLRVVSINETYPALMDLASRQLTDLPIPGGGPAAFGNLAFAPDGGSVYVTTDIQGEYLQLARLDLASGKYDFLTAEIPWDVSDILVEPTSGQVLFAVNEDGASQLYVLDDRTPRKLAIPLGVAANLEFSPDGEQVGFTLARPDAPADAFSIRLDSGELTQWTFSEAGGLDPASFVRPERIRFPSWDGRQIPAYYYRPRQASAAQPAAVLIDIHGGPEAQYRPLFSGPGQFLLAEPGIAVIHPNVRGSAGYGKTYLRLDNGPLREDSVKDIGALLDWIAIQPELDAKRVAVTGGSYGGYMVLASLVHFGDRLKAGVDIVGIANFITFLERTSPYRQDLRRAEYGDERQTDMRAVFERINPTSAADRIRSALLVAHGVNDPRVPFSEAQQIATKVQAAGRPVWTLYANNEGHGFAKKDNRDYLTAVQVLFLTTHLQAN